MRESPRMKADEGRSPGTAPNLPFISAHAAVLLAGEGRHETIVAIVGMDGLNHTGEKEQRLRRAAIKDSGIVATAKT